LQRLKNYHKITYLIRIALSLKLTLPPLIILT
jgi:hypothetical protein